MPLLDDLAGSMVGALREVLLPLEPDGSLVHFELSKVLNTMKLVQRMVSNSRGYAKFKTLASKMTDMQHSPLQMDR
eukprot:scaffold4420_cov107-Cylindrotheca_fusiformis.AAC.2